MQRFITDERTGIQYELIGDYYYPCLTIEQPPVLTKYGRMRERYLREHKTTFIVNVKQSESAKKPLNTVFQEICRHEMLGDFSADKYLNLENLQKSS